MPKNIVLLFDGTSNGIESARTNVLRLYGCLRKNSEQLVYYDPGVGTMGKTDSWSRLKQKSAELWGMITGHGLDENVKQAYRFIVENYVHERDDNGDRDRIYLIGYSRGAYTARVLAGFLHNFGLIEARNLNLLDYGYRAYKRIGEASQSDDFKEIRLYERILQPVRPTIEAFGLFDTVGSVLEPGPNFLPQLVNHTSTQVNSSVRSIRHAVALGERRRLFNYVTWPTGNIFSRNRFDPSAAEPQDVKEVWFRGCHGDVGGGFAEADSRLPKVALEWMIRELEFLGLRFITATVNKIVRGIDPKHNYCKPDALATAHESLTWKWWLLEVLPSLRIRGGFKVRIPMGKARSVPKGALVHSSVEEYLSSGREPRVELPESYKIER
jgi:uncharacterized protein (DUF2235 family)